ncbi:MAG: acyltransferase family protein [Candidatus Omnitrophica bacterium]|nr:acyltransferase family protein [Candidatus Omnitrophota bacterium]
MSDKRIGWLDTLKAIGIFFVLLAHHGINPKISKYIYSFHMPLFFFVSGYLFDFERHRKFKEFILMRSRSLVVPYFIFSFITFFFWLFIVRGLSIRGVSLRMDPIKSFFGIFCSFGLPSWQNPLDVALWFLPCLFIVELLFWFFIFNIKKQRELVILLICVGTIGYLNSLCNPIRLPWSMDVALVAIVFYGMGYIFRKQTRGNSVKDKHIAWKLILLFALHFTFCSLNQAIDMNANLYGNILYFYIAGLAGILFYLGISKIIIPNKIFNYIGRNTIILMGFSGTAFFIIRGVYYLFSKQLFDTEAVSMVMAVLLTFLQIIFMVPLIYIINKYFPYILGRSKLVKQ